MAEVEGALTHPLVGRWFHSYDPAQPTVIRWQGQVLAEVAPALFLVQLFDWIIGEPSKQILVPLADMATWSFYNNNQAMNNAYDNYSAQQNAAFNAKHPINTSPQATTSRVN